MPSFYLQEQLQKKLRCAEDRVYFPYLPFHSIKQQQTDAVTNSLDVEFDVTDQWNGAHLSHKAIQ